MPLTSVNLRNSTWMDGVQVGAQDLRLQQSGAFLTGASPSGSTGIAARPGVRYGTGDGLKISASSGMTLAVNPGVVWVQGSASANSGMYEGVLDTANTVTLATSNPTNPRIDNIIVQFTDLGTSSSTAVVTPQTGTPAASPSAPALPSNSLLLAQVAVAASTSSIVAGNITDKRVWTVATGGIVPMTNVTGGLTGQAGLYAHDLSTGRLKVSDGSGNAVSPKTAPFAPQAAGATATITIGSPTTLASLAITMDGVTEVEMRFTWSQITAGTGTSSDSPLISLLAAGSTVKTFSLYPSAGGSINGGSLFANVTPAAGATTFALTSSGSGTSGHTFNLSSGVLRVSAIPS